MKSLILAAVLLPMPVAAQVAAPSPVPVPVPIPVSAPDPSCVAVARRLMDQIMPPATRNQMMRSMMGAMSQNMVGALRQNAQLTTSLEKLPGAQAVFDRFLQRQMEIGTQDLVVNLPTMLDAMAKAYARRFTLVQLKEMGVFFATPTGQAYLMQAPTIMSDPDVGVWMNQLLTRSMQRLPEQMAKLKADIEALDKKKTGS